MSPFPVTFAQVTALEPPHAATELAGMLSRAAAEIARLTSLSRTWPAETRRIVLTTVDAAASTLKVAQSDLLLAERDSEAWRTSGARTMTEWRGSTSRQGPGAAKVELATAQTMVDLEGGREAVADGELTPVHLAELNRVVKDLPAPSREVLLNGRGADKVRELAREHDAKQFGTELTALVAARDPLDAEQRHAAIRRRRFVSLSQATDGTRLSGLLDPVAGATLLAALEAARSQPAVGDLRTNGQQLADALVDVAKAALDEGVFKPGARVRPHLSLVMSEETFAEAADLLARDGNGSTWRHETSPVVMLDGGPVLPPSELSRILCGAEITRLVVNAENEPVNLGRTRRFHSRAQQRAVLARDGGCAWAGCAAPERWIEVHHIDEWCRDEGETSVSRGVALCSHHHRRVHDDGLVVTRLAPEPVAGQRRPKPGSPGYVPPRYRFIPRS